MKLSTASEMKQSDGYIRGEKEKGNDETAAILVFCKRMDLWEKI